MVLVDRVIDGASNTFRVRMELPNADLSLPAGLRCKADLGGPPAPARSPLSVPRREGTAGGPQIDPMLVKPAGTKS